MIAAHALVAIAREYIGVPYRHQGRSRRGVDCLGCMVVIAREAGLSVALDDETNYGHTPDAEYMRARLDTVLQLTGRDDMDTPGAVALLRFASICGGHHLAMVTPVGILHAYAPARRVVETALPAGWLSRVVAVYRIPGVAY